MPLFSNAPALRLAFSYLISDPSSLLPHATIPTILSLPLPVGASLPGLQGTETRPTIRALVLDKDNTLCPPKTTFLHKAYLAKVEEIKSNPNFANNPHSVIIVSNTAGSSPSAEHEAEAKQLEADLGLPVLRQQSGRKKPFCGIEVLEYFKKHGVTENPAEIAVVGDRLATDVILARHYGMWSVWCSEGWRDPAMPQRDYRGFLSRLEGRFESFWRVRMRGIAPLPSLSARRSP